MQKSSKIKEKFLARDCDAPSNSELIDFLVKRGAREKNAKKLSEQISKEYNKFFKYLQGENKQIFYVCDGIQFSIFDLLIETRPTYFYGKDLNENLTSNKSSFSFIDLFAGIGGIRIAFERNGGKCVFTSEFDKPCQVMYETNFGEKPHGDITKITADEIPDHDILTGGFPCQAFSIIGKKRGFADIRGTLFFDVERILKAKHPKAFLLENVKQLISHDGGRTFKIILEALKNLGYFVHYKVLNGLNFGVPQKRERIIIVGFKEDYPFRFPTCGAENRTLADILEPDKQIDKKHYLSDSFKQKLQKRLKDQGKNPAHRPSVWHENKGGNIGMHPYSCALRANGSYNYLTVNGERRLTPREMFRLQGFPDNFQIVVPDTQARKQAGNSVVIPKIQAVARAMVEAMKQPPKNKLNIENSLKIKSEKIYAQHQYFKTSP